MFFTSDVFSQVMQSNVEQIKKAQTQFEAMTRQAMATTEALVELNKTVAQKGIDTAFQVSQNLTNASLEQMEKLTNVEKFAKEGAWTKLMPSEKAQEMMEQAQTFWQQTPFAESMEPAQEFASTMMKQFMKLNPVLNAFAGSETDSETVSEPSAETAEETAEEANPLSDLATELDAQA
jgi:hypothetical protein